MQANATESNQAGGAGKAEPSQSATQAGEGHSPHTANAENAKKHSPQFMKAFDGRKRPVRGLWVATASGKFYAQLAVEDEATGGKKTRRVLLLDKDRQPVATVAQAVAEMARLKSQRTDGELPVLARTPKFGDFADHYLAWIKAGEGQKAPGTIEKEEGQLKGWRKCLGERRLDQIRQSHINAYVQQRLEAGVSRSTTTLDLIALRNVLNYAIDEKWIKVLPLPRSRRNKSKRGHTPEPKRELLDPADLEALCEAALAKKEDGEPVTKNGKELCDYLRFMAYSGTRRNEALGTRWSDVDFANRVLHVCRQVTHRGEEAPKSGKARKVNFNSKLECLLLDMFKRRAQDTNWLFPSPQRGEKDIPAKSFRESLKLVRLHAAKDHPKLAGKGFHDLRHYFISYCVMSGIDYITIASWVGHQDGGVLIGKVYGHLADPHKEAMAQKLNFGPMVVPADEAAQG